MTTQNPRIRDSPHHAGGPTVSSVPTSDISASPTTLPTAGTLYRIQLVGRSKCPSKSECQQHAGESCQLGRQAIQGLG